MTRGTSVSIDFKLSRIFDSETFLAKARKPACSITGPSATGSEKGTPISMAELPAYSRS